jgi:L-proline amide hydrolase
MKTHRRWTRPAAVVGRRVVRLFTAPGSTPSIDRRRHPHGLAALEQVPVTGTRQWVLIRSEDVANPVVLFVHGGPGTSQLTLIRKNTRPLETYFTVVNWDQRRAAKSFAAGSDRARLTMEQFVDDLIALSSYLATRFHQYGRLACACNNAASVARGSGRQHVG